MNRIMSLGVSLLAKTSPDPEQLIRSINTTCTHLLRNVSTGYTVAAISAVTVVVGGSLLNLKRLKREN